jgi:hypothetical protein
VEVVLKALTDLKTKKSAGPDCIHPKILFELRLELAKPLADLFNLSLSTSSIPEDMKNVKVVAIHKKGPKTPFNSNGNEWYFR